MLNDKVAIITGSGRGIGQCIAKELAKQGAKVIIISRTQMEIDQTVKEIGINAFGIKGDVSSYDDAKRIVAETIKKFKKIDILCTCAGIYGPIGKIEDNNVDDWVNTFKINLFGTVYFVKEVIPYMKKQNKGKIILMSGAGAPKPLANFSAYAASKTAIVNLTETLSEELKAFNIDVNAIAPGVVFTKLQDDLFKAGEKAGKDVIERMTKDKAKGGESPQKAADLAAFLSSDKSNGITGRLISAIRDNYKEWNKTDIEQNESFVIRRIDNFFFKKIK